MPLQYKETTDTKTFIPEGLSRLLGIGGMSRILQRLPRSATEHDLLNEVEDELRKGAPLQEFVVALRIGNELEGCADYRRMIEIMASEGSPNAKHALSMMPTKRLAELQREVHSKVFPRHSEEDQLMVG